MSTHNLVIAAYTADPWESACPALRIAGPAAHCGFSLLRGTDWSCGEMLTSSAPIAQADLAVIQRDFPRYVHEYELVISEARRRRCPVVYELDDLILDLPADHPDLEHYRAARLPILRAITDADLVTVSTVGLRDFVRAFRPQVEVLPNYLEDRFWLNEPPALPSSEQGPVVIGYVGGSTHSADLELIAAALFRILERYGERIVFKIHGRAKPPAGLQGRPNVVWEPIALLDYAAFAAYISHQKYDLLVAPLRNTLFNRCKSAVKFLEYSSLGVAGIYSRVAPYESVVNEKNGRLASTEEEWVHALSELIENPTLRHQIGVQAHRSVQENWLLSAHAGEWMTTYRRLLESYTPPAEHDPVRLAQNQARVWHIESETLLARARESDSRLRDQLADSTRKVTDLAAELARQEQTIAFLSSELGKMQGAITWRITEPIRQLYARVQNVHLAPTQRHPSPARPVQAEETNAPSAEPIADEEPAGTPERVLELTDFSEKGFFWTPARLTSVQLLPTTDVTDIIICAGPNAAALAKCVSAIRQNTPPATYRLHLITHQEDVVGIPADVRAGAHIVTHAMRSFNFARANNLVLTGCKDDVVLLNDDTEVTAGWLQSLREASRGLALTGAHTGFQRAGNPDMWGQGEVRLTWHPINMFCVFIPKRVREVVGLLDEEFCYYGGEDVDYSCRALQSGFPLVVSAAYVHHHSNLSYGDKKARLMEESDKILAERYGIAPPFDLSRIKPLVSVVMATRNRAQLLSNAAHSILGGMYPRLELVIVDDNSIDDTWGVIAELQRSDPRVIGIRLPRQGGSVRARRIGTKAAKGLFIAFMDDDDVAWPNRVIAPLQDLMVRPELDVVYCGFDIVSEAGRQRGNTQPFDATAYLEQRFDIGLGILLLRRQVIEDVPFMSDYERAIDFDWVFRLVRRGYKIDYCPAVVLDYNRMGPGEAHLAGNLEAADQHRVVREREQIMKAYRRE